MLIEFDKVTKRFPLTTANDSVSFNIALNSIHGVVGENGAGKSTIMKILYGMYSHDSGEIRFRGERVQFSSPLDAIRRGIGMVHQHFMLIPRLTVWENILLGQEGSFWISATERKTPQLKPIFESSGLGFRLTDTVESLSVGQRQQVEILKLLYRESQVLILDEPTAVLTPQETKDLFQRLRQLKAQGKTIVIITHKIAEVLELTDTVTVMRQGRVVAHAPTHTLDAEHLTELIIGQACPPPHPRAQEPPGQPILEVQGISTRSHRAPLNKLKLTVRAGEILGIAGVSGNGQEDLVESIIGLCPLSEGKVQFRGKTMTGSTYERLTGGIALIPPDRLDEAVVPTFSVEFNAILGLHRGARFQKCGILQRTAITKHTETLISDFSVSPPSPVATLGTLSGGNQQKLVVGRALASNPALIIAAYPTRGVDIGATRRIHDELVKRRNSGAAILLISSELDEIMALSDNIAVLFDGYCAALFPRGQATELALGRAMVGAA